MPMWSESIHIGITVNPALDIETGILIPADTFKHIIGFRDIIGTMLGFCWVSGLGATIMAALVILATDITALALGRGILIGMIGTAGIGIDLG